MIRPPLKPGSPLFTRNPSAQTTASWSALGSSSSQTPRPGRAANPSLALETVSRDLHSSLHRVVGPSRDPVTDQPATSATIVLEMADGLNYRDETGQWQPTQAVFEEAPEAFVARHGPHKVILDRQLRAGGVDLLTPDGVRLVGAPLCLGYFDPVSGRSVILSQARPVVGQLMAPNQVLYPEAFPLPRASVRYTYERNRFHQDILLEEAPPAPARFGLSDRSRLEVLTEWSADTIEPERTTRVLDGEPDPAVRATMVEPDLTDERLDFGQEMHFGAGTAFVAGFPIAAQDDSLARTAEDGSLAIAKRWVRIEGRPILIEAIEHRALAPLLSRLPVSTADAGGLKPVAGRLLPRPGARPPSLSEPRPTLLAQTRPSVILDFVFELNGTKSNWLFANNTNYWVTGWTTLGGTTTFEGGVVIKFKKNVGATLNLTGTVLCKTSQYFPAVLTADEDDSVGAFIYPENPEVDPRGQYYAQTALYVSASSSTLKHLRISYAQTALAYHPNASTQNHSLSHLQIVQCQNGVNARGHYSQYYGLYWNNFYLGNALFTQVQKACSGSYYKGTVEQLTVDGSTYLVEASGSYYSTFLLRNSIVANLANLYGPGGSAVVLSSSGGSSAYNGFYNVATQHQFGTPKYSSTTNPFQTVAMGSHYLLPDTVFRQKGTTGINATTLADLKKRTTQAPLVLTYPYQITEDTMWTPLAPRYVSGAPDLGYFYDPLDYIVAQVPVLQASLWLAAGTAVGVWPTVSEGSLGEPLMWGWGMYVSTGGQLVSQGTPTQLNRWVTVDLVQEGWNPEAGWIIWPSAPGMPPDVGWNAGGLNLLAADGDAPYPTIQGRFTEVGCLGDYHRALMEMGRDHFFGHPDASTWNYGEFAELDFADCQFRGGVLSLSQFYPESVGPIRFHNCLFERVRVYIGPWLYASVDVQNGTFRGGELDLDAYDWQGSGPWDPNLWTLHDNLFDRTSIEQLDEVANDYNGYFLEAGQPRLSPQGLNDRILTSAPVYQTGFLGNYYMPASGLLFNGGSQPPGNVGLYHHTTRTSQTKEGDEGGNVNIGFHYVALTGSQPKDADADGLPDFYEDANGNGQGGDDTYSWQLADTDTNGTTDGNEDSDFDGVINRTEYALATNLEDPAEDYDHDGMLNPLEVYLQKNPLVADNPLRVIGLTPGAILPQGTAPITLELDPGCEAKCVGLRADGRLPIPGSRLLPGPFQEAPQVFLDTTRLPNGVHVLQPVALVRRVSDQFLELWPEEIVGQPTTVVVANEISFHRVSAPWGMLLDTWRDCFTDYGVTVNAVCAQGSADFQIEVFNQAAQKVRTLPIDHTDTGLIHLEWDLTGDGGETRDEPQFYFRLTTWWPTRDAFLASAPGSGVATQTTPNVYRLDSGAYPREGHWILAYQNLIYKKDEPSSFDWLFRDVFNSFASGLYDYASAHPTYTPYALPDPPIRPDRYPFVIPYGSGSLMEERNAGWQHLKDAIQDPGQNRARNLYLVSHGGPDWVGGDWDYEGDPVKGVPPQFGAVFLGSRAGLFSYELTTLLYSYSPWFTQYRFVFLDGCRTASGGFPSVFGMAASEETTLTPYLYDDGITFQRRPCVFLGWKTTPVLGPSRDAARDHPGSVWEGYVRFRQRLFNYWMDPAWNPSIRQAYEQSRVECCNQYISMDKNGKRLDWGNGLVFYGYSALRYRDYNCPNLLNQIPCP